MTERRVDPVSVLGKDIAPVLFSYLQLPQRTRYVPQVIYCLSPVPEELPPTSSTSSINLFGGLSWSYLLHLYKVY